MRNSIRIVCNEALMSDIFSGILKYLPFKVNATMPTSVKILPSNFYFCGNKNLYVFKNYILGGYVSFDGKNVDFKDSLDEFASKKMREIELKEFGFNKYGKYPTPFFAVVDSVYLYKSPIQMGLTEASFIGDKYPKNDCWLKLGYVGIKGLN